MHRLFCVSDHLLAFEISTPNDANGAGVDYGLSTTLTIIHPLSYLNPVLDEIHTFMYLESKGPHPADFSFVGSPGTV